MNADSGIAEWMEIIRTGTSVMAKNGHCSYLGLYVRTLRRFFLASLVAVALSRGGAQVWALDLGYIEPPQLKDQLGEWVILDARPGKDWKRGHITGALSFSWEDHLHGNGSEGAYRLPTPESLAFVLGRMGLTESSPVVVYGDADRSWGGEGWSIWVLSWLGHKGPIRLLKGGVQSWKKEGYTLAAGAAREPPARRHYAADLRRELNIEAVQLEDRGAPVTVIDTRSSMEWIAGRLPNAVHIPWTDFFTGKERRPIDGMALRRLFREHGVDPEKPVVFYCTAGVRSAYAWMVHTLSGSRTARNYGGGISDWKAFSRKKASRTGA
jgi:thiosulfate/3-mercaptopyruvate sulfurtransferase